MRWKLTTLGNILKRVLNLWSEKKNNVVRRHLESQKKLLICVRHWTLHHSRLWLLLTLAIIKLEKKIGAKKGNKITMGKNSRRLSIRQMCATLGKSDPNNCVEWKLLSHATGVWRVTICQRLIAARPINQQNKTNHERRTLKILRRRSTAMTQVSRTLAGDGRTDDLPCPEIFFTHH